MKLNTEQKKSLNTFWRNYEHSVVLLSIKYWRLQRADNNYAKETTGFAATKHRTIVKWINTFFALCPGVSNQGFEGPCIVITSVGQFGGKGYNSWLCVLKLPLNTRRLISDFLIVLWNIINW